MTTPTTPTTPTKTSVHTTCPGAPKKGPPPVCKFYSTSTGCTNGDTCRFKHAEQQQQTLSPMPPSPCKFILTESGCTNRNCLFLHPDRYIHPCSYKEKCTNIGCYLPHPPNRVQPVPRADPSSIPCKAEAKFMKLQNVGCSQSLNPKCPFLHMVERAD
jgi:hypothetical protein